MSNIKPKVDLTGQKFGRLTVIGQSDEDYIKPDGRHEALWDCQCDCGNPEIVKKKGYNLKRGKGVSCGCLTHELNHNNGISQREHLIEMNHKRKTYNEYDLFGDYGIGTTKKGEKFYFDLDDYNKIKDYLWYIDCNGYVQTSVKVGNILMHRIIMEITDRSDVFVDHKSHDKKDNRKQNLRIVSPSQNCMNRGIQSNNTSGTPGVYFHKSTGLWCAYIRVQSKEKRRYFKSKEEAIAARKELENMIFGQHSYSNSVNDNQEENTIEQGSV